MEKDNNSVTNDEIVKDAENETEDKPVLKKKKSPTSKKTAAVAESNEGGENKEDAPSPKKRTSKKKKAEEKTEEIDESEKIDSPSIDSLLYDSEDDVAEKSVDEGGSNFEEFLADYKAKIEKSLAMAKGALKRKDEEGTGADENEADDIASAYEPETKLTESEDDAAPQFTLDINEPVAKSTDDDEEKEVKYDPEKPRFIDTVFDFTELFIFTLAAVLIITTFFFKHTIVDGGSMMNTLQNGEHLIISDFFYTPKRGDIIVFADYSEGQKAPYVKRVIGIPGDKVKVSADGSVILNGKPLDEEYVLIDGSFPMYYLGKECTVPEGEVFVLGDHRNASKDSASPYFSTIKIDSILGKVLFRIYPFDKFGGVD